MDADSIYELCLPTLQDSSLEDEDKTERLEEILIKGTSLIGLARENAVLNVLWRFRDSTSTGLKTSPPPIRHTVLRRASPAPWQLSRGPTSLASSPGAGRSPSLTAGFGFPPPGFARANSSRASPFTSPRPSPRPAFSSPQIPHSPNLNAYEFPIDSTPAADVYEGYASDNVDWLVGEDLTSDASSLGGASGSESNLNGGAAAFSVQPQQVEMSPHDLLRSVIGEARPNEEIERALESNGYDLSATILSLMDEQSKPNPDEATEVRGTVIIGKPMMSNPARPVTPADQQRSGVVCRFWLSTGSCLRADCRFSHDLTNHVCKYWMMGNCLAGDTCIFSHDPSTLVNRLSVDDPASQGHGLLSTTTGMHASADSSFQVQDHNMFPSLQSSGVFPERWPTTYPPQTSPLAYSSLYSDGSGALIAPPPGFVGHPTYLPESMLARSRPSSRHSQSREHGPSVPPVDDTEAFPTLGAASGGGTKGNGKRHHGKRGGHGHGPRDYKENSIPSPSSNNSLADLVRMSPTLGPAQLRRMLKSNRSNSALNSSVIRELSAAAQAIPPPSYIPWLQTSGVRVNTAYIQSRQEALKHGALRNKFLQSAAQAWNRNDSRAAKALSLRGQNENDLMRKAHREAARVLYEDRDKGDEPGEGTQIKRTRHVFVDLHGLHPDEAVEHLSHTLHEQAQLISSAARPEDSTHSKAPLVLPTSSEITSRPPHVMYIITATTTATPHQTHNSTSKDKTSRAVRAFLAEHRYVWRDIVVAGMDASTGNGPGAGGIIGVDFTSSGKGTPTRPGSSPNVTESGQEEKTKISGGPVNDGMMEATRQLAVPDARQGVEESKETEGA